MVMYKCPGMAARHFPLATFPAAPDRATPDIQSDGHHERSVLVVTYRNRGCAYLYDSVVGLSSGRRTERAFDLFFIRVNAQKQ